MTAKQKQNIARFKRVVAEAKKLRKKNPKLTQPQAVKQAWAILYKGGKKVGATKIIEKGEKKNAKVTKVLQRVRSKKGTFKGIKRVAGSTHKDTKSHNVNIRVVSGINDTAINEIKHISDMLKKWKIVLSTLENEKKLQKNALNKKLILLDIKRVKNVIADLKLNLNRIKKHIK